MRWLLAALFFIGCTGVEHPLAPWINQPHAPLCVQACQGLYNECAKSALMPIQLGGLLGASVTSFTVRNPSAIADCRKNLSCCYDSCTVWHAEVVIPPPAAQ